jgi:hypothetical protein
VPKEGVGSGGTFWERQGRLERKGAPSHKNGGQRSNPAALGAVAEHLGHVGKEARLGWFALSGRSRKALLQLAQNQAAHGGQRVAEGGNGLAGRGAWLNGLARALEVLGNEGHQGKQRQARRGGALNGQLVILALAGQAEGRISESCKKAGLQLSLRAKGGHGMANCNSRT